jgi:KDO2-lipid IV(A) lauroyltransferase
VGRPSTFRHRVEFGAYRFASALWRGLPESIAVGLGGGVGWLAGVLLRVRRRDVDANLRIAFPDASPAWRRRVARACYAHLGREAAVIARMPDWSRDEVLGRVRFVDFEPVRQAAEGDDGVVVLTAHLGNWEVAGAGLAALGLPLDVVGKGMANQRFEADLFALRERLGMRVIEMSDAPKEVLRALRKGRVTALLGDQNAHRFGVFLPFFGRLAATPRGPALFALRTEAPVFVGFALRDPDGGRGYTLRAHRLEYERSGDLDEDVRRLLIAYHELLEAAIRDAPDQYFWHHKRWKTRPPEEQVSRG